MHSGSSGIETAPAPDRHPGSGPTPSRLGADAPWTLEITPQSGWFQLPIREIWEYRDLLRMLVQRDIVTQYKQTILGPAWYVLQPLLTMGMYSMIFGEIARLSTDGLPKPLFYLCGIIVWNYFAESFTRTSATFVLNAEIFGKVYFPRLVIPLSLVASGTIKFLIQLGLFLLVYLGYRIANPSFDPNWGLLLTPLLAMMVAGLGLGTGILCSALTAKYRDLNLVIPVVVQLLMFATPVIYPMSALEGWIQKVLWWNPLSHILEGFRYGFFGVGEISAAGILYAGLATIVGVAGGLLIFHRVERGVVDIV